MQSKEIQNIIEILNSGDFERFILYWQTLSEESKSLVRDAIGSCSEKVKANIMKDLMYSSIYLDVFFPAEPKQNNEECLINMDGKDYTLEEIIEQCTDADFVFKLFSRMVEMPREERSNIIAQFSKTYPDIGNKLTEMFETAEQFNSYGLPRSHEEQKIPELLRKGQEAIRYFRLIKPLINEFVKETVDLISNNIVNCHSFYRNKAKILGEFRHCLMDNGFDKDEALEIILKTLEKQKF